MADVLERVTNLLALLLETRRPLTLVEIAAELAGQYPDNEVSRRTAFERDKALLRSEGIPIDQQVLGGDRAGQTVYRVDRARYELGDLGLDDAERQALQFAVAAVRTGTEWGNEAIWKLGADEQRRPVELETSLPALAALPSLFQAASERRVVRFVYRGGDASSGAIFRAVGSAVGAVGGGAALVSLSAIPLTILWFWTGRALALQADSTNGREPAPRKV